MIQECFAWEWERAFQFTTEQTRRGVQYPTTLNKPAVRTPYVFADSSNAQSRRSKTLDFLHLGTFEAPGQVGMSFSTSGNSRGLNTGVLLRAR